MASEATNPIQTVGRRKTSVARVTMRPGTGTISVNGRALDEYFPRLLHQNRAQEPMALARALVDSDEELRPTLRAHGLLTRDARKVERKKPGRPKARKRFQFSKR